jgi:hypothetical protein
LLGGLPGLFRGREDVLLADPSADAGAAQGGEVDAVLGRELADQWSDVGRTVAAPGRRCLGRRRLGRCRLGRSRLGGCCLGRRGLGGLRLLVGLRLRGGALAGLGGHRGLGTGGGPGRRRLGLGRRRLRTFTRRTGAAADDGELGADLDGLVLGDLDLEQGARCGGGDLGVDLVGGHLQ